MFGDLRDSVLLIHPPDAASFPGDMPEILALRGIVHPTGVLLARYVVDTIETEQGSENEHEQEHEEDPLATRHAASPSMTAGRNRRAAIRLPPQETYRVIITKKHPFVKGAPLFIFF